MNKENVKELITSLSQHEKLELVYQVIGSLRGKEEEGIPTSIFANDKLSVFEAICKFLHENKGMNFTKIGALLGRSNKTIWVTYQKAKKKLPKKFSSSTKDILIPYSIFTEHKLTIFEAVVMYLREQNLTNHAVAAMLYRDDRTIWSVHDRAKKKRAAQENKAR